jgi:transketolase
MNEILIEKSNNARKLILNVANRVGGSHIGGSFSIIDFLCTLYLKYIEVGNISIENLYNGKFSELPQIIFSKGHCYLSQLAALDSICGLNKYTNNYLLENTNFFGHPKRDVNNENFLVSTGALGQGITFGNGIALSNKLLKSNRKVITIIGDGELNEGSCTEALLFASHHKLNHTFILDYNNQMSLGKTTNILSLGKLKERFSSYGLNCIEINGHDFHDLSMCVNSFLVKSNIDTTIFILNTIKGKGVSFMESDPKWHHRRFKGDEFINAMKELNNN